MKKGKKIKQTGSRIWRSAVCVAAGVFFYIAAQLSGTGQTGAAEGVLKRNPAGLGDMEYTFFVDGLETSAVPVQIFVPEQKLSQEQLERRLPEIMEVLCDEIKGENPSLLEIRSDLILVEELPAYGLSVRWESEAPELVSHMGLLSEKRPDYEQIVHLKAELYNGIAKEQVEIPVMILPKESTSVSRFLELLSGLAGSGEDQEEIKLPDTFEGRRLSYHEEPSSGNEILLLLGILAAFCLSFKEKNDEKVRKKKREERLLLDYPDLVSNLLVLTGAGYPVRQAWKKQVQNYQKSGKKGCHPVYEEMQITLNQMDTGMAETRAYGEFGKRIGLRCYAKLASLLESSVYMGGREMKNQLEAEMEHAFSQRKDVATRRGEEASTKLLLPMFMMLGVVMVMVAAPAFLTLG